jgi:hypothetical protein
MTLYRRSPGKDAPTYTRVYLRAVNWQDHKQSYISGKGITTEDVALVWIPMDSVSVAPKKGDVAVRGNVPYELGSEDPDTDMTRKVLFAIHGDAGEVVSVSKNDNGSRYMRHYELEVKR